MCGYATNETETFMPLGCYITKHICDFITKQGVLEIGPDAKSQVVIEYNDVKPSKLISILVSTMHQCSLNLVRNYIKEAILTNKIGLSKDIFEKYITKDVIIDVNPDRKSVV